MYVSIYIFIYISIHIDIYISRLIPPSPSRSRTQRRLVDRYRRSWHECQKVGSWFVSPLQAAFAHACRPSHLAPRMSLAHTHAQLPGTPPRTDTCAHTHRRSRAITHTHTLYLWACRRPKGRYGGAQHAEAKGRDCFSGLLRSGRAQNHNSSVSGVCAQQSWLAG